MLFLNERVLKLNNQSISKLKPFLRLDNKQLWL